MAIVVKHPASKNPIVSRLAAAHLPSLKVDFQVDASAKGVQMSVYLSQAPSAVHLLFQAKKLLLFLVC